MHQCLILSVQLKDFFAKKKQFSSSQSPIIALACRSMVLLSNFVLQIFGFVKVLTWICQSSYMDLSKLIHGFL